MKTIVSFLLLFISMVASAQDSSVNDRVESNTKYQLDSAKREIERLKEKMNDESYTRIPNKDFDQIIERKIFDFGKYSIVALFLFVSAIAGFVSYYFFQTKIKEESDKIVEKQMKGVRELLLSEIKISLRDFKDELQLAYDEKIKGVLSSFDEYKNEFAEYKRIVDQKEAKEESEKYRLENLMLDLRYQGLRNKVEQLSAAGIIKKDDDLEADLKKFRSDCEQQYLRLEREGILNSKYERIYTDSMDFLVRYLYDQKAYTEALSIFEQHESEKSKPLSYQTYINIVLIRFNNVFHNPSENNLALLNKNIDIVEHRYPAFGTSFAIKLQAYSIMLNIDPENEERIADMSKIFNRVFMSTSRVDLSFDITDRLMLDYQNAPFVPNLQAIFRLFPDQVKQIISYAMDYVQSNYKNDSAQQNKYLVDFDGFYQAVEEVLTDGNEDSGGTL